MTTFEIWSLVLATVGIAGAWWYASTARKQWHEAREANKQAREQHELSNRAWLLATGIATNELAIGAAAVTVRIEHMGSVPAMDIAIATSYGFGTSLPTEWTQETIEWAQENAGFVGRGALGGGVGLDAAITFPFKADERERALKGELWIRCRIYYSDCFRRRNPTIACWRYRPFDRRWAVISHDVDTLDEG
jgi:hypothetical protein